MEDDMIIYNDKQTELIYIVVIAAKRKPTPISHYLESETENRH